MGKNFGETSMIILVDGVFVETVNPNKPVSEQTLLFKFGDGMCRYFKCSDIQIERGNLVKGESVRFFTDEDIYMEALISPDPYDEIVPTPNNTPAPANGIPEAMLNRLISLCDPVKHGNDKEAMTAYGWLVSVKEGHYDPAI